MTRYEPGVLAAGHILKLDAQMGAKAPIWLDVRTVASAPNESRGLQS